MRGLKSIARGMTRASSAMSMLKITALHTRSAFVGIRHYNSSQEHGAARSRVLNQPVSRSFSAAAGPVQVISDLKEFEAAMSANTNKLTVAYHTAAWCGPCKMIWPIVQELAATNTAVAFLKIDVDEASEVAAHNMIEAMPTFLFFKQGKMVHKMVGASPQGLKDALAKFQ